MAILQWVLLVAAIGMTPLPGAEDSAAAIQTRRETPPPGEISTDRPDFTEATDIIAPRYIQIEGGLLSGWHVGTRHVGAPSTLLRIGLSRFVELRWGSEGLVSEGGRLGISDTELGVKVRLRGEGRYAPALSLIAGFDVPTGAGFLTSGHTDPLLKLCWSKSLPGDFDIAGNYNGLWSEGRHSAASVTLGRKLGRGFRGYTELYRLGKIEGDEPSHLILDAGVSKLLGAGAQVDVSVGHTLGAQTAYWYVGTGFAFRFAGPGGR